MSDIGEIIDALGGELGEMEGAPEALEGGITNRNYRVKLGGRDYVIRVPGKRTNELGIDRAAERDANECAASLGVAPPVAAMLTDPPALVTSFVEGDQLEPEDLREPKALAEVAKTLRQIHDSGGDVSTRFDSFRLVEDYARKAAANAVEVPSAYATAKEHADKIEAVLDGSQHSPVFCHNDLLAGNLLKGDRGGRIWVLDWDYAGMGDRYFDLGNFAINNGLDEEQQAALVQAYWDGDGPGYPLADLKLMMFMSDFREAMWGVVQQGLSDLDFDFAGYAEKHFARLLETADTEDFERLIEEVDAAD